MTTDDAARAVHEAIGGYLDEGEIVVAWTLTIDVAGPDNVRYLAHRAGGGIDGSDGPMVWTALGMLRASLGVAERQLEGCTVDPENDDEDADA
jgi:hypothetical protein